MLQDQFLRSGFADLDLSRYGSLVPLIWRHQQFEVLVVRALAGDGFVKVLKGWAVHFRIARSLIGSGRDRRMGKV